MTAILKPLPYEYTSLEPFIDEETMRIHHDRHHKAYVDNFNALVKGTPFEEKTPEDILRNLTSFPAPLRQGLINHGGGACNHDLFWEEMAPPGKTAPSKALKDTLAASFGSLEDFQETFSLKALSLFGSGWTWLVRRGERLSIENRPNQENPLSDGFTPILGLDIWEHAYYLRYQNRRADYIKAWWNVVNWDVVEERLLK